MSDYWLGILTTPTIVGASLLTYFLLWGLTHRWRYLSKKCGVPTCKAQWVCDEHPNRPWWLWEIRVRAHGLNDPGHRAYLKTWRAEHCERRWYGVWKYIR